eukprot:m.1540340 g.1540340  ORF g.1540340 m.1540340 type:complete len:215 (+) comp25248_c0_seq5:141-785(+)
MASTEQFVPPQGHLAPDALLQWLTRLDTATTPATKAELKTALPALLTWFLGIISKGQGVPIRHKTAKCIGKSFNIVGTRDLSTTISKCLDIIKGKDEVAYTAKAGAMEIIAACAKSLGRAISPFASDVVKELGKAFKSPELHLKLVVLQTVREIVLGLGSGVGTGYVYAKMCDVTAKCQCLGCSQQFWLCSLYLYRKFPLLALDLSSSTLVHSC